MKQTDDTPDTPTPSRRVRIVEVGPRDGLQNESAIVPTAEKVAFIELLAQSGLTDIEVSSFVNPERVPQLADAEAVFAQLQKRPGVRYTALVANERGLDRAIAAGVEGIALFTAASDAFALRNIGKTIEQSLTVFAGVAARAKTAGMWVRAYVSTAFACPFAGPIAPDAVVPLVARLLEIGADEISVADTIGSALPADVSTLTEALLPTLPLERFAYHFHDTGGMALMNVQTAMDAGISIFDSSAGGLGGCPFAPVAPGNLATEDLLSLLEDRGIATGIDVEQVRAASRMLRASLASVDNSQRLC